MVVDVDRFLNEVDLPQRTIDRIRRRKENLKKVKSSCSLNDLLCNEIASNVFYDPVSACFRRWILANYEIGDEE